MNRHTTSKQKGSFLVAARYLNVEPTLQIHLLSTMAVMDKLICVEAGCLKSKHFDGAEEIHANELRGFNSA